MLNIRVEGLTKLQQKFSRIEADLPKTLRDALEESAKFTLQNLKANTPVDTGNLRDSEDYKVTALTAVVGPNLEKAPYAGFVESGHYTRSGSFVQGQFYVQRTAIMIQPFIADYFRVSVVNTFAKN